MNRITASLGVKSAGADVRVFTISTASEDREGDILVPAGVVTTNYLLNPVVLWAHDYYSLPIGKTRHIGATFDDRLEADVEFAPTDFAQEVKRLVDEGFLRGASVGFNPLEPGEPLPNGQGYRYKRWELLEWSIVSVGVNPDALVAAKSKGLKVDAIEQAIAQKALPPYIKTADGTFITLPGLKRIVLEEIQKALRR